MGNQICSETDCLKKKLSFGFNQKEDINLSLTKNESEETRCSGRDRSVSDLSSVKFPLKKDKIQGLESFLSSLNQEQVTLKKSLEDRARDSLQFRELLKSQDQALEFQERSTHDILLHIDEIWMCKIRGPPNDQIDLEKIYKVSQIEGHNSRQESKVILNRVGHNGRKLNLLFREKIPMMGVHCFEVDLVSYKPYHECEFLVGVIEYEKAKFYPFNRSCFQQSFAPYKKKRTVQKGQECKEILLHKKIRVQVCRERGNSYITYFVNGQLEKKEKLLPEFTQSSIPIVPYIQTQFEGISFGWKNPFQSRWIPPM